MKIITRLLSSTVGMEVKKTDVRMRVLTGWIDMFVKVVPVVVAPAHDPSLQLESGDYILLENGDRLLLG